MKNTNGIKLSEVVAAAQTHWDEWRPYAIRLPSGAVACIQSSGTMLAPQFGCSQEQAESAYVAFAAANEMPATISERGAA